jgi:transcriptional regulator with XRE-family HTH domain
MAKSIFTKRHERLCELLIAARADAGLTQQYVADHLGKPQSYVAKVEGGERRLDVVEFLDLCEVIGVDPGKIIYALNSLR